MKPNPSTSSSSSSSSSFVGKHKHNPTCCNKATEFICSACLLCVCCPLATLWYCVKAPCKIGWRTARHKVSWCLCGSEKRICAAYSSFSDIDSDSRTSKGQHTSSKATFCLAKNRMDNRDT